jgi:phage terminase large subunit
VICDHDAEDRATLERHLGMGTVAAKKTVSDGIQAVQARLRPAGDGKPRLFVVRGALVERDPELEAAKKPLCLEDEIGGYVWDLKDGKQPKEQPVKENDHGCDAMRYVCAERDLGGRPRIRVLG